MDRSLAARAPAGRLRGPMPRSRAGTRRRLGTGAAAARLAHPLRAIGARPRLRNTLICLAIALPLLGGAYLWLRHSSLVAVDHVRVEGLHGAQAGEIEAALSAAARGMSTLDPKPAALMAAVARYPMVSSLRVYPSFPHGMRIAVVEQPPVAALVVGGVREAVAGDGVALGQALLAGQQLPAVTDDALPAAGERVPNILVLGALQVLGAAPPALDRLAERAYFGPRGLTIVMRNGLLVYFGDAARPHAKWLSFARVLGEHSAAGASYIDVRLPEKPAAGFAEGAAHGESEGSGSESASSSESTVAALASKLEAGPGVSHEPSAQVGSQTSGATTGAEANEAGSGGSEASEPGGGGGTEATG